MHLEDIGLTRIIKRYPRFQFTTAKKNDFTRWRVPKYTLYLFRDIKLKYPNELLQSVKTLIDSKKFLQLTTINVREYLNYSYLKLRIFIDCSSLKYPFSQNTSLKIAIPCFFIAGIISLHITST